MKQANIKVYNPNFPETVFDLKPVGKDFDLWLGDQIIERDQWSDNLVPYYNFIKQDKFGLEGNCQSAVLASLLNISLDEVPYFAEGLVLNNKSIEKADEIFNQRIDDFLEDYGLELNWFTDSEEIQRYIHEDFKNRAYQVSGLSPRGYQHVVIYINGKMVFDPHPEGGGVEPMYFGFITNLKVSK